MKRFLLTLLLAGLLSGPVLAQCGPRGCSPAGCGSQGEPQIDPPADRPMVAVPPQDETPPRVKKCYWSLVCIKHGPWGGSGTYLGSGMAITCEHIVRGAQHPVYVTFPNGHMVEAAVLASDYASDVALLELKGGAPAEAKGIPVEEAAPQVGQAVYSAGYGKAGSLAISAGRVSRLDQYTIAYDPTNGVRRQRPTTEASGMSEPGDSGGAWLTEDGKLLGVVWGGREQERSVSATTQLGGFLRDACERNRRPFPKPDTAPPVVAPVMPPPPVVDLSPIVGRLDDIAGRITKLENPPAPAKPEPNKTLIGWLAAFGGVIAGALLFYKTQDA